MGYAIAWFEASVISPSTECMTATFPEKSPAEKRIDYELERGRKDANLDSDVPRALERITVVKVLEKPSHIDANAIPITPAKTTGLLP